MLFTCCFTDGHLCATSSVEPVRVALPPAGGAECGRERPADEPAEWDGYPGRRSRREHARRPAGCSTAEASQRATLRLAVRCGDDDCPLGAANAGYCVMVAQLQF